MLKGFDYSFGNGLTVAEAKKAGMQFVCRYLSGGLPKDITKAELDNWHAAGVPVVFVWETDGIMRSPAEGEADAKAAEAQLKALGADGAVVFFAADAATMPDLHGYMAAAGVVLGKDRTGIYGGIGSVSAAFNAGLCSFGWQTIAWSNGQWDDRALLRQLNNGNLGPAQVDWDDAAFWNSTKVLSLADDFGQWPRPKAPAKKTWKEWVTAGDDSMAGLCAKLAVGPAALLEDTIKHYGYLDGSTGNYVKGLVEGTVKPTDPLPKGCRFWVFA